MSSRELQLISRIIQQGDIDTVTEWGITPDDFRTGVANSMFTYLLNYYRRPDTHGSVLGPYASQVNFPNFVLCDDPGMTTAALCSEVRKNRIALEMNEKVHKIVQEVEFDPVAAAAKLQQLGTEMVQLGSGQMTDHLFGSAFDRVLHTYGQRKAGITTSVAAWPWLPLEEATDGIQPDDYIVIYGRPKSFKSWLLAYITSEIFMQDKKILIYTKEMTPDNIYKRIVACLSQIPYEDFRLGRLDQQSEYNLYCTRKLISFLSAEEKIIVLSGKDAKGGDTVPWLESKVRMYRPDVVVIDGLYLMTDVRGAKQPNEKVKNISNDLRQMNLATRVPIISTLQANRNAAKHKEANFDEVAFSDAIGQDATLVARVINEKDTPTCMLVLAGAREFQLNGIRVNAVPAVNFTYFGEITAKDIEQAKDKDHGESDNPGAHVAGKKAAKNGAMKQAEEQRAIDRRIDEETRAQQNGGLHVPSSFGAMPEAPSVPWAPQQPQQPNYYAPPPPNWNGR